MSGSFPTFDPATRQWTGFVERPAALPADVLVPRQEPARPGVFGSGLNVGWQTLVGTSGSALEALGRATGFEGAERYGRSVADYRAQRAQEVGRSDLETAPWREGGASVLPWLGYNLAQQLPNFAITAAAYLAGGPGGAAAAARAGGMRAGLNAAASAMRTTPGGMLAAASMLPQAAGSMYREAVESERAVTGDQAARPGVDEALAALGLSPIYAAAEAIPTGRALNIAAGRGMGAAGAGRLGRAARGLAEGAAAEFVTEGVQSGMEQMFRPDLPLGQRAANVLDGALTGMAVGGVIGGGAGLVSRNATRPIRDVPANEASNDALAASVDQALNPVPMTPGAAAVTSQPDLFGAPPQVRPAEGDVREAPPPPVTTEPELPLPPPGSSPLLAEPGVPAMPLERSRNPEAGQPGREIALDTPNIIRQALQAAGENVRDNQDFRRFIGQFQAQDEVGLAREVQERLNDRRPTKRLMALAEGLGFFDREGQPRDFAAEMTAARAEAQDALAKQDAGAAARAAAKIEGIQRAERIQAALAAPATTEAAPVTQVAPAAPPMTETPIAAARQAIAAAAAQPTEQAMTALPMEWARPAPPVATAPEVAPAAAPPIDAAYLTTTPGPAPNEALAAWAKQPRVAAALAEGNPLVARMAEVSTIAGVKKQDATLARKWLERFEQRGTIQPDQQASAERLLARIYQAGGADAVQGRDAEGIGAAEAAVDVGQVGARALEGQGTAPAPAEEAAQAQRQAVAPAPQGVLVPPTPAAAPAVPADINEVFESGRQYWRDRAANARARAQAARDRGDTAFAERQERVAADADATLARQDVQFPSQPQASQTEARQDKDAAAVDAQGEPVAAPEQRVRLTPDERMKLSRAAQSPLLAPRAQRAALDAMNAPTRGKVDTVLGEFERAVRDNRAAREQSQQASPLVRVLEQGARDTRVPQAMRDRLADAAGRLRAGEKGAQARAVTVAREYQTKIAAGEPAAERDRASRKPQTKQTQADRRTAIREAAARAGILRDDQETTLNRLEAPLPTRRGVLAAALSGALGSNAGAQTARAIDVLKTGDIAGALDVLAEQSPSPQLRDLARRLAPLMGEVEVRVVEVGKDYPPGFIHPGLRSAYGLVSHDRATGRTTMHIRVDPSAPDITNTTDETIVHEAIHAAILSRLGSLETYGAFIVRADTRNVYEFREGYQPRPGDEQVLQILRLWSSLANVVTGSQELRAMARRHSWLRDPAASPDEFMTYALTSPEFQGWMRQQTLNREGYWTRFVRAVGGFLGFGARRPTYLEAVLDASNALFDVLGQRQQGPTEQFTRQRRGDVGTGDVTFARLAPTIAQAERAAAGVSQRAQALLTQMQERIGSGRGITVGMRGQVLYLSTLNHIARMYGRMFPVNERFRQSVEGSQNLLENITNINRRRATISAKFAELFAPTWSAYERLPEGAQENVRWLMESTAYEVDPRKTWQEQPWLHDKPNKERYQEIVREANKRYNELKMRGHNTVFDDAALYNKMQRYASMATLLTNVMVSDPQYRDTVPDSFASDPMTEFLTAPSQVENALPAAHDYWKNAVGSRIAAAEALWRQQWEEARNKNEQDRTKWTRLPADKAPYNDSDAPPGVNLLAKTLRDMRASAAGLEKHPYFHLGRVGEYFASFNVRSLTDRKKGQRPGAPDQAAAERVSQALIDAGFDDFTIPVDAERANVFLRVETPDQLARLDAVLRQLEKDGAIETGTIKSGHRDEASGIAAADAKFLDEAVSRFSTSPMFDPPDGASEAEVAAAKENKNRAISQLREAWLNMLPATSEARVMTQRKVVSGWSRDMMNSYAFRANVGNLALANLSTSAQMQATMNEMRRQLREAEGAEGVSVDDKLAMQQVLQEVITRETQRPTRSGRDFVDAFRAVNYAYFLGMSPAYALNNMTQVYVTLWPELSKRHGFVASAKEIARSTGVALRVMKAALQQGWATTDAGEGLSTRARRASEPDITQRVLEQANVPQEMRDYLMRLTNTGVIDIGGAARELGRLAERNTMGALDNVLRYAGAFGLYSEAAIRLASGMALYNLERQKQGAKFDSTALVPDAVRLIDDTMFNYTEANVGRALGRSGVAGRFTPIATAFQQFNAQMIEKLYREFDDVLGSKRPGETDEARAERRREGRRFLAGHAAALTVLAGSLGLPGVTAIAAAVNALKDMFDGDDEPFDIRASWRNFLADVLGKDVGEVVARGLPRAIGVETSSRLGEQDIIPFSRFMADRRKWEDAAPDQALRMLGAPFSMVGNVVVGAREMMAGNILSGMQKALPVAIRSPVSAFRLTQEGYVNEQGVRLPMEPGASAVLAQALGYQPAAQAEYQEANIAQAARRGVITRDAARIRNGLLTALEKGDQERAREWLQEAQAFDENQPAYAILPRLGTALQARTLARVRADALDVPLGVSLRDITARERTAFANY